MCLSLRSGGDVKELEDEQRSCIEKREQIKERVEEGQEEIDALVKQQEKEMQSMMNNLESDVSAKSKDLVKNTSVWQVNTLLFIVVLLFHYHTIFLFCGQQHAQDNHKAELKNNESIEKSINETKVT